jgi:AcrR family transcriptional regulator
VPSRRRAPRLSHAERRARLVAAAVRVIQRRGLQATQVGDVVREAGVSRGTFYLHFESKRHLIGAVTRELLDRMLPRFAAPAALHSWADLLSALRSLSLQALEAADRERAVARLVLVGGAGSDPAAARWLAAHEESWRRVVARVLGRARAARLLREAVDVAFVSECIVGSVQRILRAMVLRRGEVDCAALADALARFHTDAVARP